MGSRLSFRIERRRTYGEKRSKEAYSREFKREAVRMCQERMVREPWME
jgi:hypothetical protein